MLIWKVILTGQWIKSLLCLVAMILNLTRIARAHTSRFQSPGIHHRAMGRIHLKAMGIKRPCLSNNLENLCINKINLSLTQYRFECEARTTTWRPALGPSPRPWGRLTPPKSSDGRFPRRPSVLRSWSSSSSTARKRLPRKWWSSKCRDRWKTTKCKRLSRPRGKR